MTVQEMTIAKIRQLPEPLVQEVSDFVDFLQIRHDAMLWQRWVEFGEGVESAELGFADYLANLEDYEDRLAAGEIQW